MPRHVLLLVAAGLLVAADNPREDPARKDREQLQGYWDVTRAERDGKKMTTKDFQKLQVIFTDKKLTFSRGAEKVRHDATYKLDPTQKPKAITITFITGPDEGKTFKGIYALKDKQLEICWSESGQKRPTAFSTKPKSFHTLLVLKRGKP